MRIGTVAAVMYVRDMTIQERLPPGKYKLRVEDYACLGEAGVFGDARTELVGGEIIVMSPEWRPHMRIKDELAYRIRRALEQMGSDLFVGTGGSVAIGDHEMPRPDIIVTSEVNGEGAIPGASVALLVEVSASTLDYDLGQKAGIYATAAIPEYWIVDVNECVLYQMWKPLDGRYTQRREDTLGVTILSENIAGISIVSTGLI